MAGTEFSAVKVTSVYIPKISGPLLLPMAGAKVAAGFPSPADDYSEPPLDLAAYLVRNPAATMLVRASGDSMKGAGIMNGSLLVVDRSLEASDGHVVIAVVDGDFTVKRFRKQGERVWLEAANARYRDIEVSSGDMIWGVVTQTITTLV